MEEITNYYRTDELPGADLSEILDRYTRGLQTKLFTGGPGEIVEFFSETQTATVKPTTRRFHRYENFNNTITTETKDLPEIENVPVFFPQCKKAALTFPIEPGDECYIAYAQRTFDKWLEEGGVQDPSSRTLLHTINGAVAFPGIKSNPNKIPDYNEYDTEFRNFEGDQFVRLKENKNIEIYTPEEIVMVAGKRIYLESPKINMMAPDTKHISTTTEHVSTTTDFRTSTFTVETTDKTEFTGTGIVEAIEFIASSHLEVGGVTVELHSHTGNLGQPVSPMGS